MLARTPGAQVAAERLALALADFDAATIATTHQFCQQSLAGLGIAADRDPGEEFVEDIKPLVDEAIDDLYVAMYRQPRPGLAQLSLADAREIGRAAVFDPQADLDVGPTQPDSAEDVRVRFARAVRSRVLARRRALHLVTFDDLVLRLAATLTDPVSGEVACQRLRHRYRVVLVDEFQDTDPAQWQIVRSAFHGHRTVILIGDPKQAIYAFRGADVYSYLDAVEVADHRATLTTNWRSDAAVVDGIGELLGASELGDPRIVVRPIAANRPGSRLHGLPGDARVRLRQVRQTGPDKPPAVGDVRRHICADVAADVVGPVVRNGPAPGRAARRTGPGGPRPGARRHRGAGRHQPPGGPGPGGAHRGRGARGHGGHDEHLLDPRGHPVARPAARPGVPARADDPPRRTHRLLRIQRHRPRGRRRA